MKTKHKCASHKRTSGVDLFGTDAGSLTFRDLLAFINKMEIDKRGNIITEKFKHLFPAIDSVECKLWISADRNRVEFMYYEKYCVPGTYVVLRFQNETVTVFESPVIDILTPIVGISTERVCKIDDTLVGNIPFSTKKCRPTVYVFEALLNALVVFLKDEEDKKESVEDKGDAAPGRKEKSEIQ